MRNLYLVSLESKCVKSKGCQAENSYPDLSGGTHHHLKDCDVFQDFLELFMLIQVLDK